MWLVVLIPGYVVFEADLDLDSESDSEPESRYVRRNATDLSADSRVPRIAKRHLPRIVRLRRAPRYNSIAVCICRRQPFLRLWRQFTIPILPSFFGYYNCIRSSITTVLFPSSMSIVYRSWRYSTCLCFLALRGRQKLPDYWRIFPCARLLGSSTYSSAMAYQVLGIAIIAIVFVLYRSLNATDAPKIKGIPEIPGVPLFGNLLQLGVDHARVAQKWATKYGPVFQARLGNRVRISQLQSIAWLTLVHRIAHSLCEFLRDGEAFLDHPPVVSHLSAYLSHISLGSILISGIYDWYLTLGWIL